MAAGNDAAAAAHELATREGVEPNAESIIKESQRIYPPNLKAASLLAINDEATEALDDDAVQSAVGGTVLSATVRGTENPQVVYAIQADDGRVVKGVIALSEVGGGRTAAAAPEAKKAAPRRRTSAKK